MIFSQQAASAAQSKFDALLERAGASVCQISYSDREGRPMDTVLLR